MDPTNTARPESVEKDRTERKENQPEQSKQEGLLDQGAPPPETWAVVVVHGVGDATPGGTLEAFVPQLVEVSGNLQEDQDPKVVLLPKPEEELPRERRPFPRTLADRFPMALRGARVPNPNGKPAKVVFAEVYWADLAATGEGLQNLLIRLFTIIFDLRYLVYVAATHWKLIFPRWLRLFLYFASLIIIGPVAALSTVVLYLLLARFVDVTVSGWMNRVGPVAWGIALGAFGVVAEVFGTWLWLQSRKENWRRGLSDLLFLLVLMGSLLVTLPGHVAFSSLQGPLDPPLFALWAGGSILAVVAVVVGASMWSIRARARELDQEEGRPGPGPSPVWGLLLATAVALGVEAAFLYFTGRFFLRAPVFWNLAQLDLGGLLAFFGAALWAWSRATEGLENRWGWFWRHFSGWTALSGLGVMVFAFQFDPNNQARNWDVALVGLGVLGMALALSLLYRSMANNWGWALGLVGVWILAAVIALAILVLVRGAVPSTEGWDLVALGVFVVVAVVLCLVGGRILLKWGWRGWGQTWTWLLGWAALAALGVTLMALMGWFNPQDLWNTWLGKLVSSRLTLDSRDLTGPSGYLAVLLFGIRVVFFALGWVMAGASLLWLFALLEARLRDGGEGAELPDRTKRALPAMVAALGAAYLQIGLWLLIVPALALLVLSRLPVPKEDHLFDHVETSFEEHLFASGLVVSFAFWVWALRKYWVAVNPAPYPGNQGLRRAALIPRLLVHVGVALWLVVLSGASVVWFLFAFWKNDHRLHGLLIPYAPIVVVAIVPVVTVLGTVFRKGLGNWLHVLMDVVSHFYDPRPPVPNPFAEPLVLDLDRFETQQQIERRVEVVIEQVLANNNVTYLTVVSHSQGTIIALDVLWRARGAPRRTRPIEPIRGIERVRKIYFVTMGSPITHLYQHYFPFRYPPLFFNYPVANTFNDDQETGWGNLNQTVNGGWLNVFRVNDFIGTHIEGKMDNTFPKNVPLAARGEGHTGYWGQREVLVEMRPYLPG